MTMLRRLWLSGLILLALAFSALAVDQMGEYQKQDCPTQITRLVQWKTICRQQSDGGFYVSSRSGRSLLSREPATGIQGAATSRTGKDTSASTGTVRVDSATWSIGDFNPEVDTRATLPVASTAGRLARMTDGGSAGAPVGDDGSAWTCGEQKSQRLIIVACPPYNAAGDGRTDDTTAIQAALNAVPTSGATVLIPPASTANGYRVTGGLTVKANTTLRGYGALLKAPVASAFTILTIAGTAGAHTSNVRILGLALDMQATTQIAGANNISVVYADNIWIDGITSLNQSFEGVHVYNGGSNIWITNSRFEGGQGDHIHIGDVAGGSSLTNIFVLGNVSVNSYDDGIAFTAGPSQVIVRDNVVNGTTIGAGIDLSGVNDILVDGNIATGAGQHNIRLLAYGGADTYDVTISNNFVGVPGAGHMGINVSNANGGHQTNPIRILNNRIETGARAALYLHGHSIEVAGNWIATTGSGIAFDATRANPSGNNLIHNNTFSGCATAIYTNNNKNLGTWWARQNTFLGVTTMIDYPSLSAP